MFCVLSQPTKLQKKQALLSLQCSLVSDEQESKSISVSESEGKWRDLAVVCHTPPLKKQSNKVKCHYPASVPSHLLSVEFGNGMVMRMGSRISPCFWPFWEVDYDSPSLNSFSFSDNFFIFLFVSFSEGMECIAYACVWTTYYVW